MGLRFLKKELATDAQKKEIGHKEIKIESFFRIIKRRLRWGDYKIETVITPKHPRKPLVSK